MIRSCAVLAAALASIVAGGAKAEVRSSYVLLGENGTSVVRVVTDDKICPTLRIDGKETPMAVRAEAATLPLRPTASSPSDSKPSAFPVLVCEAHAPPGAQHATLDGKPLPLPPQRIDRIVVIGDTGCRLKVADDAFQDCNDLRSYPFATIAARAADWGPDVVIHVGDYLYRENRCPDGHKRCAGSPWGYGWDAWAADFFTPAKPLLKAAPWIVIRGNHENCNRAGQGWYRLLDVRAFSSGGDCSDPARDFDNDDAPPYAVPLGGGAQVVVMDMSIAGTKPLAASDPRALQFARDYDALAALTGNATFTFMATHKPILGFAADLRSGNQAIQSVFATRNPELLPSGVDVLLAGHVHLWEQVSFSTPHPSQFITGFSGTQEDAVPMPATLPPGATPALGAQPDAFSSWVDGFGYMTLERTGSDRWRATVWNRMGEVVNRCEIEGRRSRCEKAQVSAGAADK
jgi:hypothetical protein